MAHALASPPSSASPPPDASSERIRAFLRDPEAGIDALGRVAGAGRAALDLLDRVSESHTRLGELNQDLIPLIARFREPGTGGRLWRWFTGAQLEQELSFGHVYAQIEASAELGVIESATLRELGEEMERDIVRLDGDIAAIEADVALGRTVASERYQRLRALTGRDAETWQRLSRRVANLEATATALRLTQQQYRLAIEHGRTVASRFDEIHTLLIPIWYQRMGFSLFARRADAGGAPAAPDPGAAP